ncbi:MAG: outer membrane protein assembly factor BamC [Limnobacter sp.]|nr:outer membrane protein assembly factor BamC [Limnobacter sp.]
MNKRFLPSSLSGLGTVLIATLLIQGCAAYNEAVESQKVAYKRAEKREVGLEVPPDLTAQAPDDQFVIPEGRGSAAVSASDYYSGRRVGSSRNTQVATAAPEPVAVSPSDAEIRKVGSTRSILIQRPPEQIYQELRKFWRENGFDLVRDDPAVGVMETNWLENRAAIPMDGVRKIIGRVFDGLYSSNMRDKYRTRVEAIGNNATEVFITHRGMEERYTDSGQDQNTMTWQSRPSDPELEAEMSNRFLAFLVGDETTQVAANGETGVPAGTQVSVENRPLITINRTSQSSNIALAEEFPLAWRRVGIGLDRAGFIVEDRDRSIGLYYVRYSPDSAANSSKKDGFFSTIFGLNDNDSLEANMRFQVQVTSQSNDRTLVEFLNEQGKPVSGNLSTESVNTLVKAMGGDPSEGKSSEVQ